MISITPLKNTTQLWLQVRPLRPVDRLENTPNEILNKWKIVNFLLHSRGAWMFTS